MSRSKLKSRFFCPKCRLWFFWTQGKHGNYGKCTVCFLRKEVDTQGGKRK